MNEDFNYFNQPMEKLRTQFITIWIPTDSLNEDYLSSYFEFPI